MWLTNNNRKEGNPPLSPQGGKGKRERIKYLKSSQTRYVAQSELIAQDESENKTPSLTTGFTNTKNSPNIRDYSNFITGLWRGFHQSEGLTIYYGYQFRADGSFLARHRIYRDRETLEDITWQGEWQFRDNTLKLKGFNSKDKNQQAALEFNLTNSFRLAYRTGSLSQYYNQMILNKLGQ